MGSGFHGTNGIDAVTSHRIYHTYVLPRLIYGLEVLPLKKKHVENLESFHRKSMRYLQSLPPKNSNGSHIPTGGYDTYRGSTS